MTTESLVALLGFVKVAEMELSEAAFKASDGELSIARVCLLKASEAIGAAMEAARQ